MSAGALLDGAVDATWFSNSTRKSWASKGCSVDGSQAIPFVRPKPTPWPHDHLGIRLPIPDECEARTIQLQLLHSTAGDVEALQQGPAGAWLRAFLIWAQLMEQKFIGGTAVTGNWRRAAHRWKRRLDLLPNRHRAAAVYKTISKGGYFKFNATPPIIRVFRNHPDLRGQTDAVWKTLNEQLREESALPFDTQSGLLSGNMLLHGDLPKGIFSIRPVPKKHTDKVRVTMNMRPLKPFFDPPDVAVELDTNQKLRHRILDSDVFIGADQHSSFFHYELALAHRTFAGFSLHAHGFSPGVAASLAKRFPHADLLLGSTRPIGLQRFGRGDFRLVFVMAGLLMGVSPAVKMLSTVMDAIMDVWALFPVGTGESLELPRGSNYVDDSIFMLSRAFPRNGFEMSARVALEYILLGFRLNLPKSHFLPTPWFHHLGLRLVASAGQGCTFSLTNSRATNIAATLASLARVVVVGHKVPLSLVAAVVGTI